MRVETSISAATTDATQEASKAELAKAQAARTALAAQTAETEDTTSLTSSPASVTSLTNTALQTTPSQGAKLEALKQAVQGGTYTLDASKIADALAGADV